MRLLPAIFVLLFLSFSGAVNAQGGAGGALPLTPALQLNWYVPAYRENGSVLSLSDIGGYELRYRLKGTSAFTTLVIRGASNRSYLLRGLKIGTYEFQIATFDADGLYSKFVPIAYKLIN